MRLALIGLALIAILPAGTEPASAQRGAYCLSTGSGGTGDGLPDCAFHTWEQCMAAVGGGNDGCFPNPRLGWNQSRSQQTQQPRRPSRGN